MSEVSKPVRLSKVAREFNLGVDSIVEFLASKGIEVERKPNTKLEPEQYALVRANFADEKAAKEKEAAQTVEETSSWSSWLREKIEQKLGSKA